MAKISDSKIKVQPANVRKDKPMGDNHGTGIKNPVGTMKQGQGTPAPKGSLKKAPKSMA